MQDKLTTCRCCLSQVEHEYELYEFSSEVSVDIEEQAEIKNFIKISECFKQVTGIELPVESEDSSKICTPCLSNLKFCYLFQKKCWDNDKIYSEEELHQEQNIIEYVDEEEYVDEQQDEDTNDGFETVEEVDEMNTGSKPSEVVEVTFQCDLCPKVFRLRETYRRHFQSAHPEEHEANEVENVTEDLYKCKKCDSKFTSKGEARNHLKSAHSNEEARFNCETCSKTFKSRYQLIVHGRSHTGEKPFSCAVCDRRFSMSSNLQKHLDTHNTEKTHHCTVCNQSFKTQRSLKFHTICYHQIEDKVKCTHCEKTFVNKSYLKMHMLYHTGEKNFTCVICHGKYYKTSHLKRHVQNVHFKLRLMKCELCESDFVRKETYKAHIISHHKRFLSNAEYEDIIDRIKTFKPPPININDYILEKQPPSNQALIKSEDLEDQIEMIEEVRDINEGVEMETDNEYYEEESELYEDEQ